MHTGTVRGCVATNQNVGAECFREWFFRNPPHMVVVAFQASRHDFVGAVRPHGDHCPRSLRVGSGFRLEGFRYYGLS